MATPTDAELRARFDELRQDGAFSFREDPVFDAFMAGVAAIRELAAENVDEQAAAAAMREHYITPWDRGHIGFLLGYKAAIADVAAPRNA